MRPALLVFLCALMLTLALAAPVLFAPGERLIGDEIVGRHHDAYTVIGQLERPYPLGHPLQQPVTDLAGAAVARLTGPVAAYNVIVLASFPLAALFAFLLARHFGLSPGPAALAGLAFAFAPSHLAHAAYHPQIVQVQWIPLYLLALARCLDRWTPARAAALVAAAGVMTLATFYFGFFAALLTPIAILAYPSGSESRGRWRERLATGATLAAGAVAVAFFLRLSPGRLAELAERYGFPASDLERYSARAASYLLPPVDHPLVGDRVTSFWAGRGVADGLIEQQLTLGIGLTALAAVALVASLRQRRGPIDRGKVVFLAVTALAALAASLELGFGSLVHRAVPLFRAYARFGIFAQLLLAILAGAGFAVLRRQGGRARAIAVLLLGLLAIEYAPFPPWRRHPVLPTEAHRWIARQPGAWRLLDCVSLPPAVAHSIFRFLPRSAQQVDPARLDCMEPGVPAKLAALGVSHLLLRPGSAADRYYPPSDLPPSLVELGPFRDSRLLAVAAAPAEIVVQGWRGFSWREVRGEGTFRWLGDDGDWLILNSGPEPVWVMLEVELNAFPAARRLEVTLGGVPIAEVEVGAEPVLHRVGPLLLAPGANRLGWRPQSAATVADEILGNGDPRALSVAVGEWRWLPSSDPTAVAAASD